MSSLSRRFSLLLLPVCLYAGALYAQDRIYTLGTTLDLAGGGTNQVNGAVAQPQSSSFFPFYGAYPSLTLTAAGAHTVLNANYGYGYNRFQTDPKYTDQSHTGSLNFNWTLSPELKI